jgi:AraC-like DNA-binding protein
VVSVQALLAAAESLGLKPEDLHRAAGLDPGYADSNDAFVADSLVTRLWQAIADTSGDRSMGIRLARALPRGSFRALEYMVRTSPTFEGALRRLVRFQGLLRTRPFLTFVVGPLHYLRFDLDYDLDSVPEQMRTEYIVAATVQLGRESTGRPWSPKAIHFRHRAPDDLGPFAALDGPVKFEQSETEVFLSRESIEQPMAEADPPLCAVLESHAGRKVQRVPRPTLADSTERQLFELLPGDEPELEEVAARLQTSPRALQRGLQEEGTSFREILDRVRLTLAKTYLGEVDLSVFEIALLLGYSDATAFHRAFKRWTGVTPGAFRKQHD